MDITIKNNFKTIFDTFFTLVLHLLLHILQQKAGQPVDFVMFFFLVCDICRLQDEYKK